MDKLLKFALLFIADNQVVNCCFLFLMNNSDND